MSHEMRQMTTVMKHILVCSIMLLSILRMAAPSHAVLSTAAERTLQQMISQSGALVLLPMGCTSSQAVSNANAGSIYYDCASNTFKVSQNGAAFADLGVQGGSNTFSSITVPVVIGGTGTTSTLSLRSTSGVGTTGANIIFQVGNNGAIEVMRLMSGVVTIGSSTGASQIIRLATASASDDGELTLSSAGDKDSARGAFLDMFGVDNSNKGYAQLAAGTAGSPSQAFHGGILFLTSGVNQVMIDRSGNVMFGGGSSVATTTPTNIISLNGQAARTIWMERNTTSNTAGNQLSVTAGGATSGATDKSGGILALVGGTSTGTGNSQVIIRTAQTATASASTDNTLRTNWILDGSGLISHTTRVNTGTVGSDYLLTGAAHTSLTASTERISVNLNLSQTYQWATGALTTQRFALFQAPTIAFVGASTVTDVATVAISGAPVAGANTTQSSTHGLLIQAGAVSSATNAFGLTANAPTGGTTNYAAQFKGEVLMGSVAFASLGTPANGTITYCNDCDAPTSVDSTCTSAGAKTGSFAVRANGAWKCIS